MSGLVGGPFGPLKFGQLTLGDLSGQFVLSTWGKEKEKRQGQSWFFSFLLHFYLTQKRNNKSVVVFKAFS